MDEERAPTVLSLLDYLLDEIRETSGLLRVADQARAAKRPWWRTLALGLIRTPSEVSADMSLLYVGQNIDRARDHWRAAVVHLDELQQLDPPSDAIACLAVDLGEAGLADVLPQLQHDAIPSPVKEMTVHLAGVVDKIRECDRLVLAARSRWLLERMRGQSEGERS